MNKKTQYKAFELTRKELLEKFGIVGYEFAVKADDDRVVMEVYTPKGGLFLGLIMFGFNVKKKLLPHTMDGMDRKPINKIVERIARKLNKELKGKK